VNVADLKPDTLYRPTRPAVGLPNAYALMLPERRVTQLLKRLRGKMNRNSASTSDLRALRAADEAAEGEGVVLEVFARYLSQAGHRVELRRYLGLRFKTHDGQTETVALRAVKSKPGYTKGTTSVVAPSNKQEEENATVQP
jgi:hypothetical protein